MLSVLFGFVGWGPEPLIDIFLGSEISLAKYLRLKKCLVNRGDVALRKIPQVTSCLPVLITANDFVKHFKRVSSLKDGFRDKTSLNVL